MSEQMEQWIEELLKLNDAEQKMTEKQANIVRAAVEIFAEKGYAASSTSEIAQKAGVAEGTIFRHYKTKKDLLLSIVTPLMAKLIGPFVLRDFTKVLDSEYSKYEDFVRAVMLNRLEFVKKQLPIVKIMMQEIPFHPELKEPFKQLVGEQVVSRMQAIVEHFQQQGQIIPIPPLSVVRMTASVVIGYLAIRFIGAPEYDWDEQQDIEHTIQFIMYGLSADRRET